MLKRFHALKGIFASLRTYHGRREHRDGLDRLYARFVQRGDLVFDVGAHVGDRVGAFRRLGARVVAVEPQPALVRVLTVLYGRDRAVTIEPLVIGRTDGYAELMINHANPTVSTASPAFVAAAAGAPGWEKESWTERLRLPMTTLDALIARHGMPTFIKIDVEGFEAEALAGLSTPVPALSFEFTTIQRDVALTALSALAALGYEKFDASLGESHRLMHGAWQSASRMRDWIAGLPHAANSGDVYALR
ncbi:MAG: FkbM family methyltransferase [Rhodoplanes sp.]|uniref:FkbM family methyltransferase n=1 Tax=Rhodoplanes sp. TaxID=1968906 RepID=UPI00184D1347|nr:FkbM family methyltransferase [Rhodoplanes sp.]NVO14833.1 FkbM family methyltransferase [Rhodoplanes sp.]